MTNEVILLNKTQKVIIIAYQRGYRINDSGELINTKKGTKRAIRLYGKQRYPTMSISVKEVGNNTYAIPVHQFAAYCFYGNKSFNKNNVVRHLDGNTLNVSRINIVLGTHSENNLDKSPEVRRRAAIKARKAQGKRSTNAKFTNDQILNIRQRVLNNESQVSIAKYYSVTRQCINLIIKRKNYGDVK